MGKYSFKSSGTTQAQNAANQLAVTPTAIGILTPLSLGTTGLLQTSTDLGTQLADNLRNLVLTNWGERLGLYNFGANLRPLMTDLVSQDDFDSQAITRIRNAVQRWMPYIDLQDFISAVDRSKSPGLAVINLIITFNIPSLNIKGRQLQATLYAI
jgi:phage baseplate assembly protein W